MPKNNITQNLQKRFFKTISESKRSDNDKYVLIMPEDYDTFLSMAWNNYKGTSDYIEMITFLTRTSIVFTYSAEESTSIPGLTNYLLNEQYAFTTVTEDYPPNSIFYQRVRPMFDRYGPAAIFPIEPLAWKKHKHEELRKTAEDKTFEAFVKHLTIKYKSHFSFYHLRLDLEKIEYRLSNKFNYFEPIRIEIGIKSQKSAYIILEPKLKDYPSQTKLSYKYGEWNPISIVFSNTKGKDTYLALLALFLYVTHNNKSALLKLSEARKLLLSYGVELAEDDLRGSANRIMKYIRDEKFRKLHSGKGITKSIGHLLNIFPRKGDFLRLETSFEIDKIQNLE